MAYLPQADGITLYSTTIAATGGGTIIDTTGYGNIVFTFEGTANFNARIEGSDDQTDWYTVLVNNLNGLAVTDLINADGGYQFKTSYQYVRLNVLNYSGTLTVTALGRPGPGASSADNLAAAFNQDTPLFVDVTRVNLRKDSQNALILSDSDVYAVGPNQTATFYVRGYATVVVQTIANYNNNITHSNDGVTFTSGPGLAPCGSGTANYTTNPTGAGFFAGPLMGQYVRFSGNQQTSASPAMLVYFKSAAFTREFVGGVQTVNLAHIVNNGMGASPGSSALLPVGGYVANGLKASAGSPIVVSGNDILGNSKVIYTDTSGRMVPSFLSPYDYPSCNIQAGMYSTTSNTFLGINFLNTPGNSTSQWASVGSIRSTYQQTAALAVQETSQQEGQSHMELLAQMLQELKILNQQIYELPNALAISRLGEPPGNYRSEPSIFIQ